MIAFVIASAVLALLALGYVLRPVWQARPLVGGGMLAMLALVTGLTYGLVGTPSALEPAQRIAPRTITEAISRMQDELQRDPNQVEGWRLLARAYAAQARVDEARDALTRAVKLAPDDPDLLPFRDRLPDAQGRLHGTEPPPPITVDAPAEEPPAVGGADEAEEAREGVPRDGPSGGSSTR